MSPGACATFALSALPWLVVGPAASQPSQWLEEAKARLAGERPAPNRSAAVSGLVGNFFWTKRCGAQILLFAHDALVFVGASAGTCCREGQEVRAGLTACVASESWAPVAYYARLRAGLQSWWWQIARRWGTRDEPCFIKGEVGTTVFEAGGKLSRWVPGRMRLNSITVNKLQQRSYFDGTLPISTVYLAEVGRYLHDSYLWFSREYSRALTADHGRFDRRYEAFLGCLVARAQWEGPFLVLYNGEGAPAAVLTFVDDSGKPVRSPTNVTRWLVAATSLPGSVITYLHLPNGTKRREILHGPVALPEMFYEVRYAPNEELGASVPVAIVKYALDGTFFASARLGDYALAPAVR